MNLDFLVFPAPQSSYTHDQSCGRIMWVPRYNSLTNQVESLKQSTNIDVFQSQDQLSTSTTRQQEELRASHNKDFSIRNKNPQSAGQKPNGQQKSAGSQSTSSSNSSIRVFNSNQAKPPAGATEVAAAKIEEQVPLSQNQKLNTNTSKGNIQKQSNSESNSQLNSTNKKSQIVINNSSTGIATTNTSKPQMTSNPIKVNKEKEPRSIFNAEQQDESEADESEIDERFSPNMMNLLNSQTSLNQSINVANPGSITNYSFSKSQQLEQSIIKSIEIDPNEVPIAHIPCLYLPNNSEYYLLYFHGNGEDVNLSADLISHLQRHLQVIILITLGDLLFQCFHPLKSDLLNKVNVIAMEYPGYGIYQKPATLDDVATGIISDAEYLYRYMIDVLKIQEKNIILFGRSIGSGTAAHLAARNKPGALVLMSAFRSLQKVAKDLVGRFFASMLKDRFDNEENIKRVTSPTFILHGQKDTFISYNHSVVLFENCSGVCEMVLPKEMSHVDVDFYTDLSQRLIEFLTQQKFNLFNPTRQPKLPTFLFREPTKTS